MTTAAIQATNNQSLLMMKISRLWLLR